ncbi:GGDEF domain-containing protein [Paucibacter sp. M5-1]|uniref:GGDEF domain-containing protein n=1 Tax=Paucibacter sp. M5-1 TaxID=3015998 RepID=UPI0022B8D47B|nr:GGDEF domain-containing protein [Paucibacter sp. M5-1]MCZ7881275.1 diguanylate cyclase [Paucibacter sp. M5-1]
MGLKPFEESVAAALAESARGDYQAATERLSIALLQCPASHQRGRARVLAQLAHDYPRLGNLQASVRCASEAVALAEHLGDTAVQADALTSLSFVYAQLLMGRDALECGLRALACARSSADSVREAWALNRIGVAYSSLDNPAQACDTTAQALEIALTQGNSELSFSCLNNLAYFWLSRRTEAHRRQDAEALALARTQARKLSEQATAQARASDSHFQVAVAVSNLVEALLGCEEYSAARPLLDEFEALARQHGYLALKLQATVQRALILKANGQIDAALRQLQTLMDSQRDRLPPKLLRGLIYSLYETHKACGDYRAALDHLERHTELERQTARDTMALQTEVMLIRQEVEQAHARAEHAMQDVQRERKRARELERDQLRLRDQAAALDRAAHEDVLTGLHNRRHAEFALPLLIEGARQAGKPISLAMLDVDHFKQVNDDFGHGVGDRVLQQLAQLLRQKVRSADLLARVGGEEFVIALVGTQPDRALEICERLRQAVADYPWGQVVPGLRVRVSIGLAAGEPPAEARLLQERSDRALYAAKRGGRDRVCSG